MFAHVCWIRVQKPCTCLNLKWISVAWECAMQASYASVGRCSRKVPSTTLSHMIRCDERRILGKFRRLGPRLRVFTIYDNFSFLNIEFNKIRIRIRIPFVGGRSWILGVSILVEVRLFPFMEKYHFFNFIIYFPNFARVLLFKAL